MRRPVALPFGSYTAIHWRSVSGKQPSPGTKVAARSKERNVLLHWRVWRSEANTSSLFAIAISVSPPPFWQFDFAGQPTRCHCTPRSSDFQNHEVWVVLPPGPLTYALPAWSKMMSGSPTMRTASFSVAWSNVIAPSTGATVVVDAVATVPEAGVATAWPERNSEKPLLWPGLRTAPVSGAGTSTSRVAM